MERATYLITPTLYNAYNYYTGTDFAGIYGDAEGAAVAEAKARQDFLNALNKVKTPPKLPMLKGLIFEDIVRAMAGGNTDRFGDIVGNHLDKYRAANGEPVGDKEVIPDEEELETAREIAERVKGGLWQQKLTKRVGDYVLFGYADVINRDTIHDIKRVSQYSPPKYFDSIQHLLYMVCEDLPKFRYEISDGKRVYVETYDTTAYTLKLLISRIDSMVAWIRQTPEFEAPFEANWRSKY